MTETPHIRDDDGPYLVVSADSHAGPSLDRDLRAHCPPDYADDFDRYVATVTAMKQAVIAPESDLPDDSESIGAHEQRAKLGQKPTSLSDEVKTAMARTVSCAGQSDEAARRDKPGSHRPISRDDWLESQRAALHARIPREVP